jgi:hypothetical protein
MNAGKEDLNAELKKDEDLYGLQDEPIQVQVRLLFHPCPEYFSVFVGELKEVYLWSQYLLEKLFDPRLRLDMVEQVLDRVEQDSLGPLSGFHRC